MPSDIFQEIINSALQTVYSRYTAIQQFPAIFAYFLAINRAQTQLESTFFQKL